MMKRKDIAKIFKVDPAEISRMLSPDPAKRRKPTYSFCLKLKGFLGGEVEEWKEADVETLKTAFALVAELKVRETAATCI